MAKPTKIVIDCSTGIESVIELTDAEIAQMENDRLTWEAEQARIKAEQDAMTAAKTSAQAKLKALGLSDDEVAALIG